MVKVVLRFQCATENSNLESYLIYLFISFLYKINSRKKENKEKWSPFEKKNAVQNDNLSCFIWLHFTITVVYTIIKLVSLVEVNFIFIKFMFSKKVTNIWQSLPVYLTFTIQNSTNWKISSNHCGFIRKPGLYVPMYIVNHNCIFWKGHKN